MRNIPEIIQRVFPQGMNILQVTPEAPGITPPAFRSSVTTQVKCNQTISVLCEAYGPSFHPAAMVLKAMHIVYNCTQAIIRHPALPVESGLII